MVNSAGVMEMVGQVTSDNLAILDRTLATNLRGSWLMMAKAAETLGEGGRIIAFSSSVLGKSFPGYGAYIASKAGVEGLVRVLANELRGAGSASMPWPRGRWPPRCSSPARATSRSPTSPRCRHSSAWASPRRSPMS
ncbi:SDR family oxidoreductase [Salinicola tamaricis]|uniref:SDR family oxidoreductase n=1 Tax=Salinicola tamaricis TaxID=1771309 RepID=UPI000D0A44C5